MASKQVCGPDRLPENVGGEFLTEGPSDLRRSMARDAVVYGALVRELGLSADPP